MSLVFSCENCGRECWRDKSDVHRTRCFECCRYHEQTEALKAVEAERDALKAQLASLVPPPWEDKWQPIETAPKDGREVLVHDDGAIFLSWWDEDGSAWMDSSGALGHQRVEPPPQHWMPLPSSPLRSPKETP